MTSFYLIGGASGIVLLLGFLVLRYRKKMTELELLLEEKNYELDAQKEAARIRKSATTAASDKWMLDKIRAKKR